MRHTLRYLNLFRAILLCSILSLILAPALSAYEEDITDPFEGFNRGVFWFNDKVDRIFLEPVAREYESKLPICFRHSVSNFFTNLKYPTHLVSTLISRDFDGMMTFTGRFLLNSTIGIAGLIDVAGSIGLEAPDTDIGAALGGCGVPAGPYIMLPFLGPTNFRDGLGRGVESVIDPISIATYNASSATTAFYVNAGSGAVKGVSTRAQLLEAVEAGREASLDYYLFVQSAYYQYRHAMILRAQGKDPSDFKDDFDDQEWLDFEEEFEEEGDL